MVLVEGPGGDVSGSVAFFFGLLFPFEFFFFGFDFNGDRSTKDTVFRAPFALLFAMFPSSFALSIAVFLPLRKRASCFGSATPFPDEVRF